MIDIPEERFEQMIETALGGLPRELARVVRNVAVVVEPDGGPPGLLGLYHGVPLTERSSSYSWALPDEITIYRRAICAICETEDEVVEEVRRTVVHEVGHYFGIDDDRLHELGW
jgi:predicted Zn-dependent protease with MMP-like domain